ncbi:hypothetical protein [Martelella mediterranea]|uniref:hypothetical protein n=1 Tax=Martelella mediterranea TaxID=293089 RepID=UPI0003678AC2|nr:hypothetical protein [Martelella mediterranea]
MQTRSIEIDFDVHKAIELERRGFDETPNEVLRRMLGIDVSAVQRSARSLAASPIAEGRSWVGKGKSAGLMLPHGTDLQMVYNGQHFTGHVDNGSLVLEGQRFSSPSGAADELCRTRDGKKTSLNGKELIQVRLPGESEWQLLKAYEQQLHTTPDAA